MKALAKVIEQAGGILRLGPDFLASSPSGVLSIAPPFPVFSFAWVNTYRSKYSSGGSGRWQAWRLDRNPPGLEP